MKAQSQRRWRLTDLGYKSLRVRQSPAGIPVLYVFHATDTSDYEFAALFGLDYRGEIS